MSNTFVFTDTVDDPKPSTNQAWYNTQDGIEKAVKTLEGFNKLVKVRHQAGYQLKETLAEFIVLGMWQLDSNGNAMKAMSGDGKTIVTPKQAYQQLGCPTL